MEEKIVSLKVYKFNKLFLEESLDYNQIKFDFKIASSSFRGVSYKLIGNTKNKTFAQYEIQGWKNKNFKEIKNFLTLHHSASIISNNGHKNSQ